MVNNVLIRVNMDKARKLHFPRTYTNMPSNLRSMNKSVNPGIFLEQECQNTICCRVYSGTTGRKKSTKPYTYVRTSATIPIEYTFYLQQTT